MGSLDEVVDDLYGGSLADFVARRDAAVRAARAAKDRDLARRIGELRKPTLAAWAVNLLMRDDPGLAAQVRAVGEGLQEAERSLDGPALRELSTQRRRLVAGLVQRARRLAAAAGQKVSDAAAQEVDRTLNAALLDPRVADAVTSGTLTQGQEYVGFGSADDDAGTDRSAAGADGADDDAGTDGSAAAGDGDAAGGDADDRPDAVVTAFPVGGRAGRAPGAAHREADDGTGTRSGRGRTSARRPSRGGRSSDDHDDDHDHAGAAAEQERAERERAERDRVERERAERERRAAQERAERERERARRQHEQAVAAREEAEAELDRLQERHDQVERAERDAAAALEEAEEESAEAYRAEEELVRQLAEVRRRLAEARSVLPRVDEAVMAAQTAAHEREKAVRAVRRELERARASAERAREREQETSEALPPPA